VYYLVSSVVVVGVEDRPPLGDLGCALRLTITERNQQGTAWVCPTRLRKEKVGRRGASRDAPIDGVFVGI
jgi:hypothetical protein